MNWKIPPTLLPFNLGELCEVKGDPDYVWNPQAIMTDKNVANKITVGHVLGEDMWKRTVSCQWHYLRCAKKQSNRVTEKSDKKK